VPPVILLPPSLYFDFLLPLLAFYFPAPHTQAFAFIFLLGHFWTLFRGRPFSLSRSNKFLSFLRIRGVLKKQILKEVLIVLFLLSAQDDVK
jgi:hypothetical protein